MTIAHSLNSTPFVSVLDQMDEELRWLVLRLRVIIERTRQRRSVGPPAEYRGLYVTDQEVDSLLTDNLDQAAATIDHLVAAAEELRTELDVRAAATLDSGVELPIDRIAREFGLDREERLLLVIALAPYFDAAFEKVYAYANDDIAKRWPTAGLALQILADDRSEMMRLRRLFLDDAPLSRHQIMHLGTSSSATEALLNRQVALDPHVAELLLGHIGLDSRLQDFCVPILPTDRTESATEALAGVLNDRLAARVYLGGRWQAEKENAVAQACSARGLGTLVVDGATLVRTADCVTLLDLALRDSRLHRMSLLFREWNPAPAESDGVIRAQHLANRLQDHPLPVFFSDRSTEPTELPQTFHLHVVYAAPGYDQRRQAWEEVGLDDADAAKLAATYKLGLKEVRLAAEMARSLAIWNGHVVPSLDDIKTSARTQAQPRLSSLAQKITPRYTWDDIVLPTDRLAQLRELANQVLYEHVVYEEWGIAAKSSLGRGVAALFAGQSGTGKTMAAEILAQELGLEVYKIDLAGLVSKYIGETEKNLGRVFEEASDTNAILFFDEADSVFGKRSEVKDSHDRYANIEVSYLLQKMEEYDGIVVLASNMRANLDEAFLRRMRAIVEFPFPEIEDRLRIWQHTLQSNAPLAGDIDLPAMARQFRIAGGNIRNIVILAAFLAASESKPISMSHMIQAAKREYQKLGRLITESDFGKWYEEARG